MAAAWSLDPETFPYFSSNSGKVAGGHNDNYFYVLQKRCPVSDGLAVLNQFGATVPDPFRLRAIYGDRLERVELTDLRMHGLRRRQGPAGRMVAPQRLFPISRSSGK
jgi:hypothetical protein